MKTLYLLRHAKAEPGGKDVSDIDRPLSPRGLEASMALGEWLRAHNHLPELALSSPSLRTRQTLEKAQAAAGWTPPTQWVQKLYLASEEEILRVVRGAADAAASLLVVGHNPGMHHASLALSRPDDTPQRLALDLKYPTGALAVLRFDCAQWKDVSPGEGELVEFRTPAG